MHVVITGGAGFIGSNLAQVALAQGHQVTVVDDLSTGFEENLQGLDVDFVRGSVLDGALLSKVFRGASTIIHLAALGSVPRSIKDPKGSHVANATGTLVVLESARDAGIEHVIAASSSSVYGLNPAIPKHERDWVRPMSPYAVSKLATEQYTLAYQQSYGLRTLAFRFFNVYGPGQRAGHAYSAVIPTFLDAILRGEPVQINGDGSFSRDFTYVGTVCEVLLDAALRGVTHPEPVNLAFGTNTSLLRLVDAIRDIVETDFEVLHRQPRPGDVPHSCADNSVLRALFPDVHPVPLEQGLDAAYTWLRDCSGN